MLDGVYRRGADGPPVFVEADEPTDDKLHALLQIVITRLMKMLTRRGVLVEDMGQTYLAEPDATSEEARTLRPLQTAAVTYRIALGPRAGQKMRKRPPSTLLTDQPPMCSNRSLTRLMSNSVGSKGAPIHSVISACSGWFGSVTAATKS